LCRISDPQCWWQALELSSVRLPRGSYFNANAGSNLSANQQR